MTSRGACRIDLAYLAKVDSEKNLETSMFNINDMERIICLKLAVQSRGSRAVFMLSVFTR